MLKDNIRHGNLWIIYVFIWICASHKQTARDSGHAASLTHWGRVTHICVSKLTIIVPDKGLSPDRRQAIIWINAGRLLNRTSGTKFREILSEIHKFPFKKMQLKMSSAKRRPFCLNPNALIDNIYCNQAPSESTLDCFIQMFPFIIQYFISKTNLQMGRETAWRNMCLHIYRYLA